MTDASEIGWGSYREFEGPYFPGKCPYVVPPNASFAEKALAVITATEGGHYDAVNMYDRCIVSTGIIQMCEAGMYGTSKMLGYMTEGVGSQSAVIAVTARAYGSDFTRVAPGTWRFAGVHDTTDQKRLFLGKSDGTRGSWDDSSKQRAKTWAAAFATALADPVFQVAQRGYLVSKVLGYAPTEARVILWDGTTGDVQDALRAAYLSFSANLPTLALANLKLAVAETPAEKWGAAWCDSVLEHLIYGGGIGIYPRRYQKVQSAITQLFGVTFSDAEELHPGDGPVHIIDTHTAQLALQGLGYDLGPSGADNQWGLKTQSAVVLFQQKVGIPVTGRIDQQTTQALNELVAVDTDV